MWFSGLHISSQLHISSNIQKEHISLIPWYDFKYYDLSAKLIFKMLRDYLQITFILGFDFRIQKSVIIRVMTPLKLVNANFICILHFLFQVCYVEMSQNLLIKTISDIPPTHMINIGAGGNNITITKSCKNQNNGLLCCHQDVICTSKIKTRI